MDKVNGLTQQLQEELTRRNTRVKSGAVSEAVIIAEYEARKEAIRRLFMMPESK